MTKDQTALLLMILFNTAFLLGFKWGQSYERHRDKRSDTGRDQGKLR